MHRVLRLLVMLAPLTACSTLSNTARSYLTAPDGLQIDDERVRALLQRGMPDSALRAVSNRTSALSPDDRLLRLLYQGTAARYAGREREAGGFFDQAFAVSEDRFTKSISRTAEALVTNDYALPYTAGQNERLLLHCNALLAWSAHGDADAASVEARRLVALLASFGEPDADERPMRAMMHALASAVFEQSGDWNDADVARRNAIRLGAGLDSAWRAPSDAFGDVVVLIERGDVAHKVAVGLSVPIFAGEDVSASDGRFAAERMLADFGAMRNGGLWWDDTPSWRFAGTRYGAYRGARASYLLDMSWPVLRRSWSNGRGSVQIVSEDNTLGASVLGASVSDAIASDYRRDRGAIMTRTIARAVTKYVAAKAIEAAAESAARKSSAEKDSKKKRKRDDDAARATGLMARLFVNATTTMLERADTRAWTLLPATLSMVRLRLPAGTHELLVDASGTRQLSLPNVVVRGGRTTVLSVRLWREVGEGIRAVVERSATDQASPHR